MNYYNSQTLTHAGYVVALTLGIVTLFSRIDAIGEFFKSGLINKGICYTIFSLLLALIIYSAFRIIFWAWMSHSILQVKKAEVESIGEVTDIWGIQACLHQKFIKYGYTMWSYIYWARLFWKLSIAKSILVLFIFSWLFIAGIGEGLSYFGLVI